MLLIKTYIDKDNYGGRGIFAAEDISAGTVIWRYHPDYTKLISVEDYFAANDAQKEIYQKYSYPIYDPLGTPPMVGLLINFDNSRYTNHDENPNTGHTDDDPDINIALRDIAKGEEITCNYREFDPEDKIFAMGISVCKAFLMEQDLKNYA